MTSVEPSLTAHVPSAEEVAASYDTDDVSLAMMHDITTLHTGLFVEPGRTAPTADLAQVLRSAGDRLTDYLIDLLEPGPEDHLLDIGCGAGGPALRLVGRTGTRVTGITVSKQQADLCQELRLSHPAAERAEFACADAMALPYPDGTFDLAWSIDCFMHLADRSAALREALRVLRPGGRLLLTEFALRGTPTEHEVAAYTQLCTAPPPTSLLTLLSEVEQVGLDLVQLQDLTPNMLVTSELVCVVYQQKRAELERRFGTVDTDALEPLRESGRGFFRDHLGYHLLVLRKPLPPAG
ncbi:class I SAM-dependent methyltransferase [Streptomyces sp. AJS327]|uniref:class I SAM-dependent methyltransferase n=1 Tax=Streptomyces sp. AJS327 TaxID=2545265 RepID=UPI0015E02A7B|nr:class I SAM-dependent methyltransferase [Streptomyces sp. AJS327]MBA0050998.1 class I SAM-dependent methyltransferase [Streptomyces sp. AJS327]